MTTKSSTPVGLIKKKDSSLFSKIVLNATSFTFATGSKNIYVCIILKPNFY